MRTPEQVKERLAIAWRRRWTDWLGGAGEWPLSVPLDPPTEAQASASWSAFARWVEAWQAYAGPGQVRRANRVWSRMGSQAVPTHLDFARAWDVAQALGAAPAALFHLADARFTDRLNAWPALEASLRSQASWLQSLSDDDYARAAAVLEWLSAHPQSGLYARQLPIGGVDTKWLEQHAGPIAALLADRLGVARGSLASIAGLKLDAPKRRIRLLDPVIRQRFGGLSDITVRMDELVHLEVGASVVLVVENLQSALACEDLSGAVVIAGGGFAASELADLPWLHQMPLVYWGDIDSAGLQILSSLRARLPHVASCLMDEATLLQHRDLWSTDPYPARRPSAAYLTPHEFDLARGLAEGRWGVGIRLEQERIPWHHAWAELTRVACNAKMGERNPLIPAEQAAEETQ